MKTCLYYENSDGTYVGKDLDNWEPISKGMTFETLKSLKDYAKSIGYEAFENENDGEAQLQH